MSMGGGEGAEGEMYGFGFALAMLKAVAIGNPVSRPGDVIATTIVICLQLDTWSIWSKPRSHI